MCLSKLFKKKPKKVINSKFQVGNLVRFRYRNELTFGYVYEIKEDKDGNIIYDIQVGGQCPWFVYNLKEDELNYYTPPKNS